MSPLAVGLVAVAALLHVTWNALLKTSGDPLRTATVGMTVAGAVIAPIALAAWWLGGRPPVPPEVVGLAVVSGAIEVAYFVLLAGAYGRGDLSVVYPIARGTAPLPAVLAGVTLLGERLPPAGWAGVALLLTGLLALQRPWRFVRASRGAADAAVPWAVAAGVAIAAYSAIDRVAVRLVDPWLYAGLLWVAMTVGLVGVTWLAGRVARLDRREAGVGSIRPSIDTGRAAMGGLMTLAAYLLVLWAFSVAPLAAVAPLRESAVVLASGWGVLRLREARSRPDAARRLASAALVLAGAVLLALAGPA